MKVNWCEQDHDPIWYKMPIRLGAEIHYSAIQPDDVGQTWLFRIYAVPVVPSPFAD